MLGTPVDDRVRARQLLQRAEDRAVAPSRRELLPGDHRVAPAKPVAEHTCCLPHADGREPPIGKQGLPAGRQDASRNRSGGDRRRIWLVAAALICRPQLTDRSEPQAMPELRELPRRSPDPGVICEKKVCAARWRVVSGHRGPCRCEPVPHPGGERAGVPARCQRGGSTSGSWADSCSSPSLQRSRWRHRSASGSTCMPTSSCGPIACGSRE